MGRLEVYRLSFKERIKRRAKQLKRYCYVSSISAAVTFILLFIFVSLLNFYYITAFVIAYLASATLSFFLNKILIFNIFNPKSLQKQYYQFFMVNVLFFLANLVLLYVFVEFFGLWYLLAQVLISLIIVLARFLSYKNYVFNHI